MSDDIGAGFYSNKTLLITGVTGLVGKVLLETIVRALPRVKRVYVMIRSRTDRSGRQLSPAESLRQVVIDSSAFDPLRAQLGGRFDEFIGERIEAIDGDLSRERLGISEEVYVRLLNEVDVIINSAALAVFDAPLDQALETNTLGPQRILELARNAAKNPVVAHISTCYVNNISGPVFESPLDPSWTPAGTPPGEKFDADEEVRYITERVNRLRKQEKPRPVGRGLNGSEAKAHASGTGNGAGRAVSTDPEEQVREERLRQRLVKEGLRRARHRGWKDTYTFTKAMGEQLFARHCGETPAVILRPSIIESSLRTPARGWIDGFRMMDPLIVGYARGQIADFPGNPEAVVDVVPVDSVVNALLMAIPWTHSGKAPFVFQVASGAGGPLLLKDFRRLLAEYFEKEPLCRLGENGLPRLTFPEVPAFLRYFDYRYLYPLRLLERLHVPLRFTSWGKRRHNTLSARRNRFEWLRNMAAIYGPYAENQARFLTFNLTSLWETLSPEDKENFPFLLNGLDWKTYFHEVHFPGIKHYLLQRKQRLNQSAQANNAPGLDEPPPRAPVLQTGPNGPELASEIRLEPLAGMTLAQGNEYDPSKWKRAEKILTQTRSVRPVEARAWTTPRYKKMVQQTTLELIRLICRQRLNLRRHGSEHIPERGPFIMVANHTSHADTGVLLASVGGLAPRVHPTAAADYWFRSRLIAWLLHSTLGAVPFDRHARNIPRAISLPAEVLRNSHSLIFYPEGSRSDTGEMHDFKSTLGLLALASGAPVLPVHIAGTSEALPKGKVTIRRHPVCVHFGPPLRTEQYLVRLDRETLSGVAQSIARDVQAAVEQLRDATTDSSSQPAQDNHPDMAKTRGPT